MCAMFPATVAPEAASSLLTTATAAQFFCTATALVSHIVMACANRSQCSPAGIDSWGGWSAASVANGLGICSDVNI